MLRHLLESPPLLYVSELECPAVLTLGDAGYVTWTKFEPEGGGGGMFMDFQVTSAGKQVLGL